ncbi:peroxide stress protein YaaA [Microbacteriaceae bacterium VKM Ac-2854]|nr:peroxide stress protein YaaA [Microbacteriaceae bacterium VKM Ac-2854]
MHVLLPPSETKRDGGSVSFRIDALAFPELRERRAALRDALVALSADHDAAVKALKLGPKQADEVGRNAALLEAAAMPVMDRFTGVLYDALDAGSLDSDARRYLAEHVVVHSALWGLLGAGDPIPAYRLSHDSRVPGFALKRWWAAANSTAIAGLTGLVLDLRSESYAALGPLPAGDDAHFVRVRTRMPDGTLRSLNHFNKQGKGRFVRALAEDGVLATSVAQLREWAGTRSFELLPNAETGELDLVMPEN